MWLRPWHLSVGFRPFVDFCVWTLEVDGLHAGPFLQHLDGNGSLRAAGMDYIGWEAWFSAVVAALDAREKSFRPRVAEPGLHGQRRQRLEALKWWNQSMPPRLWTGSPPVRDKLEDLWEAYVLVSPSRRRISPGDIERTRATRKWSWVKPYRRGIPSPLQVYYVAYPAVVDYIERPSSVVLSLTPGEDIDQAALRDRIRRAAAELARSNQAALV
jgi:hypothetical protein